MFRLFCLISLSGLLSIHLSASPLINLSEKVPQGLIIRYKDNTSTNIAQIKNVRKQFLSTLSFKKRTRFKSLNMDHIVLEEEQNIDKIIEHLKEDNSIKYIEPDYPIKVDMTNSFNTSSIDELSNIAISRLPWGLLTIDIPEAWAITMGTRDIILAILDSGIDYTHPDIRDNMWVNSTEIPYDGVDNDNNGYIDDYYGWNFADNNCEPMDDLDHGTHVAGIAGASGNNNQNISGVNRRIKLMALKFISRNGYGTTSGAINGIMYAINNGARIINNSWGSTQFSQALQDAIEYANKHNILIVAAAGNESTNNDSIPHYPASYPSPSVLSVGATNEYDYSASFSNYGKESVDVMAPGEHIFSTVINGYESYSGTSMATPFVSGIAALILAHNNNINNYNLKRIIMESSDYLETLKNTSVTDGRVNAHSALLLAARRPSAISKFPMSPRDYLNDGKVSPAYGCGHVSNENSSRNPITIIMPLLILPLLWVIRKKHCHINIFSKAN